MRKALTVNILLLVLFVAGCGSDPPSPLQPLSADAVILAFGDSLTSGSGADSSNSYPSVLSALLNRKVINAGIPGEVSAEGKQRLPGLLDRYLPDLLILCHGGNDMLRKLNRAITKTNIEQMVEAARQRDIPVVLMGVPEPGLLWLETAEMYDQVADKYGLPYEGSILAGIESDDSLKSDRIHPNSEGYRIMATALHRLLRESGAIN